LSEVGKVNNCERCSFALPDSAITCPKCGYTSPRHLAQPKKKHSASGLKVLIIAIVVVIILAVAHDSGSRNPYDSRVCAWPGCNNSWATWNAAARARRYCRVHEAMPRP